jgi:hypothetical protein
MGICGVIACKARTQGLGVTDKRRNMPAHMEKRLIAGREITNLAADNGVLALVGATVFRALSDLWDSDELLALDALEFLLSDNCESFISHALGINGIDADRFFRAAVSWRREGGLLEKSREVPRGTGKITGISYRTFTQRIEEYDD